MNNINKIQYLCDNKQEVENDVGCRCGVNVSVRQLHKNFK